MIQIPAARPDPLIRPRQHRQRILHRPLSLNAEGREPVAQLIRHIRQIPARFPIPPTQTTRILRMPQPLHILSHQNLQPASQTSTLDALTEK
jgi:hypothetical protein